MHTNSDMLITKVIIFVLLCISVLVASKLYGVMERRARRRRRVQVVEESSADLD